MSLRYCPPLGPLDILHRDEAFLVVNKPSGLLSVPGRGEGHQDCLIHRVQALFPSALIVHRLDMSTSGLMLLALSAEVHRTLSKAFIERLVDKSYVARVAGRMQPERGWIELPLLTDWPKRPRQKVDFLLGKPSQTRYQVLSVDAQGAESRVRLFPVTGRSHQLRVHLLAMGHPILGDGLYGPAAAVQVAPRLMLHAESLAFPHPLTGAALAFHCPADF